jgi:putative DeoR family transcriptional regulator (stage III sporulation protein D)
LFFSHISFNKSEIFKKGENVIYDTDERAVRIAEYLTEHNSTVRKAALVFGVSKSTVHKDVTSRLKHINRPLYERTARLMETNKNERHLRGGMATKLKYLALKENAENNS